jgi:RNA polymerase sigma factor (sigma-70 family)
MNRDTDLVRAAREGVPGAMGRLLDQWVPVVIGWCARLGGPTIHPEDAAQDVFERVLDRITVLQSPEAFPSWLFQITRRVLAQHRRRAWFRRWLPDAVVEATDPAPDPQRATEGAQITLRVREALAALPSHHREVLVLCDLEERADTEAADLLGIPRNTVKSRLHRARAALRASLKDLAQADPELVGTLTGGAP